MSEQDNAEVTGRCYCGKHRITAPALPKVVAYCHCDDCRRVTGAPVAAFAAFDEGAVTITPDEGRVVEANPGVKRTFCSECGSPITGRYDYLPGQVYLSVGLLDQVEAMPPSMHAHYENKIEWLCLSDELEQFGSSSRERLF